MNAPPRDDVRRPRRRRLRWVAITVTTLAMLYALGNVAGWPVAWPSDWLLNLGSVPDHPTLHVPTGARRLVVLQHGLWRTPASLGRLERTLRAHGYEVLNPYYPSTSEPIEAHAERLARAIVRPHLVGAGLRECVGIEAGGHACRVHHRPARCGGKLKRAQ